MLDYGSHQPHGATYTEINYNEIRCKTGSSVVLAASEVLDGHTWLVASIAELRSPHHTDVPDQRPEEGSSLQSCLCTSVFPLPPGEHKKTLPRGLDSVSANMD